MDSSRHDEELLRAKGRVPPVESSQWWLGPVVLLGILVLITIGVELTL